MCYRKILNPRLCLAVQEYGGKEEYQLLHQKSELVIHLFDSQLIQSALVIFSIDNKCEEKMTTTEKKLTILNSISDKKT